jgi:hypothetical protein
MAKTRIPVVVASIVALLSAIAGLVNVLPWPSLLPKPNPVIIAHEQQFGTAMQLFEGNLRRPTTDVNSLRAGADEAYRVASLVPPQPLWQCQVVRSIYDQASPDLAEATPIEAYNDYLEGRLPDCDEIAVVARLDWNGIHRLKTRDSGTKIRLNLVNHVVAKGTAIGAVGWIYLGYMKSGQYAPRYTVQLPEIGNVVTLGVPDGQDPLDGDGLPVQDEAPQSVAVNDGSITAYLLVGSRYEIRALKSVPDLGSGAPASYVYGNISVTAVAPVPNTVARYTVRRKLARREAASRIVPTMTRCPSFQQHNSMHAVSQSWVYIGQTSDNAPNQFVPGTALLQMLCVPRNGSIIRTAKDAKVLVGPDPHWPGVVPQGRVLPAGAQIQVAGDVSVYPFDATATPNFCSVDPKPQKDYAPIPPGHEKRYCVYLPFITM